MSTDVEDPHPDPDEIKPFVAVGPSEDYSITVHKSTFDTGFILVTIIFILVIVTVLITCIFFSIKQVELNVTEPLPATPTTRMTAEFNSPANASAYINQANCMQGQHTVWVNDRCRCQDPYYGPTCNLEKHDPTFYAVGTPNEDKVGVTVLDQLIADGKSYNAQGTVGSCSDYCRKEEACMGFIYQESGLCTLLTGDVIVPENDNIAYAADIPSTLYIKSSDNLKFTGRIFLSEYPNNFPARFWLTKHAYHFIQLFPREMVEINFYPNYINVHGCYTGIYCLFPFTMQDVPTLLQHADPDKCYLHAPKTELVVPDHWRYHLPLYVMYLPA